MRWDKKDYKDKLKRWLKRIQAIKIWQLIVLFLLSVLVSATLLRLNNLNMLSFRRAVATADEKGDTTAIQRATRELGAYVTSHMNTSLGDGFYLVASYERAKEVALNVATSSSGPDGALYQQASVQCQDAGVRAMYGGLYVSCVLAKVQDLGTSSNLVSELDLPRSELYKINFVSPFWSPDLAGFSVAISAFILVIIIIRITGVIILKILIKKNFTAI